MQDLKSFYVTFANIAEAKEVAHILVDEKLVACVNIIPEVTSIYRWEDKVQQESEVVAIGKTVAGLIDKVKDRILELHSYDIACFVVIDIDSTNEEFCQWVNKVTTS